MSENRKDGPYRAPAEQVGEPPPPSIGRVRRSFVTPGYRPSKPLLALAGVLALVALAKPVVLVWLGIVILVAFVEAVSVWLSRRVRVDVGSEGVDVVGSESPTRVRFEEVDELYLEGQSVRLVTYAGATHRIPLTVGEPEALMDLLCREISTPLLAQARRAIEAGELLRFGVLTIDRERICTPHWGMPWSHVGELRAVGWVLQLFPRPELVSPHSVEPGAAIGSGATPHATVALQALPHPTVLLSLMTTLAKQAGARVP